MNNENNINGIPSVNDIKIEDTPAESFASLYGNGTQPPAQPVQPQSMPNPQVVQPTQQVVEPIQPVEIDSDRLQSIEEQLSKTSQYKPEDFQQEKIDIPTTNQYEKNKSGLAFVIGLFVVLALAIVALPFITKFFS